MRRRYDIYHAGWQYILFIRSGGRTNDKDGQGASRPVVGNVICYVDGNETRLAGVQPASVNIHDENDNRR